MRWRDIAVAAGFEVVVVDPAEVDAILGGGAFETEPTASLPVMIFTYAIAPYDDWHRQAWAAGFVLLMMVLVLTMNACDNAQYLVA